MPARRKQRVREAKQELYRQLVIEAAARVFAEKGYEQAKVEEIAREAGLSPGTLYSVLPSKAEIFSAVHEAGDAELLRCGVECARRIDAPFDALLAGVRGYVGYFLEHPDFLRMNLQEGIAWGTEKAGAHSRGRTAAWKQGIELLALAVQRCMEAGLFHEGDPTLYARMLVAMQQVQLADWVEGGMRNEPEKVIEQVVRDVERLFRTSSRARSSGGERAGVDS